MICAATEIGICAVRVFNLFSIFASKSLILVSISFFVTDSWFVSMISLSNFSLNFS